MKSRILGRLAMVSGMALATAGIAAPAAAQKIDNSYICVFKEGTVARGQERAQANAAAANAGGNVSHVYTRAIRGFAANMSARGAAQMQASNPRIAYCEQDQVVKIVQGKPDKGGGSTGSASETTPWGIVRVGGGQTGATGRAFVIDSGVDLDHPDLNVNTAMSRSFTREKNGDDGNGHGTHVAGTIAAIANNNIGVVGVAAGAEVVAVKVLTRSGSGSNSGVIAGVDYVAQVGRAGEWLSALSLSLPAARTNFTPPAAALMTALSSVVETPPPRLIFATSPARPTCAT